MGHCLAIVGVSTGSGACSRGKARPEFCKDATELSAVDGCARSCSSQFRSRRRARGSRETRQAGTILHRKIKQAQCGPDSGVVSPTILRDQQPKYTPDAR